MSRGLDSYLVYKHTNKVDGKVYIGVTSKGLEKRAGSGGKMYKSSPKFYAAIKHFGWDSFEHQVVAGGLTIEQAAELEKKLIATYDSTDDAKGYNLHEGGFPSAEQRKAYESSDRVGRIKATLHEQRSDSEYRKIMRERMLEVWRRPEHRARLAEIRRSSNNPGGRPRVALLINPGNLFFHSKNDAARFFGLHYGFFTSRGFRLTSPGECATFTLNNQQYQVTVVDQFDKESELLEAVQPELF